MDFSSVLPNLRCLLTVAFHLCSKKVLVIIVCELFFLPFLYVTLTGIGSSVMKDVCFYTVYTCFVATKDEASI